MGENFSAVLKEQAGSSSLSSSSAPGTPLLRPTLSRASSMNLVDSDDSFVNLTLLDALVVIDSHLDLARRHISRKGQEWRSNVQATASSVKRSAEEMLNQGMQLQRRRTRTKFSTGAAEETKREHDDRINIDKELARFKARVGNMSCTCTVIAESSSTRRSRNASSRSDTAGRTRESSRFVTSCPSLWVSSSY